MIIGVVVASLAIVCLAYLLRRSQNHLETTIRLFETALLTYADKASKERRELANRIQAPEILPLPEVGEAPNSIGFDNDDEYWGAVEDSRLIERDHGKETAE